MNTRFSCLDRDEISQKLNEQIFDILIIGGGITGCGIALDAASRGMKVALIEMQDFASGTSGRSTKLVHGGLRYLKQFELGMVADMGKERAIVYENGPHVTIPEPMLLPIYKNGTFGKFSTSIGLKIYDYLAKVNKSERRIMLSADETLMKIPMLKRDGLLGSGYYVEYRTDDARLTIEVLKKSVSLGVTAINYTKAVGFKYHDNKVCGVEVHDLIKNTEYVIEAKKIVNAAGPWVDEIRSLNNSKIGKKLKLTKGVHIVVNNSVLPLRQAIYFDTPDKRMIFAIPREGKVYIGTTDTFYDGDIANPRMTNEDKEYLLKAINYIFQNKLVKDSDIESSWAGLRPLIYETGKNPSEISRKDEIWQSETGLISIAGGKLTGYRKMAIEIVDKIYEQLYIENWAIFDNSKTKNMTISGGDVGGSENIEVYHSLMARVGEEYGLTFNESLTLAKFYGSNCEIVFEFFSDSHDYILPSTIYCSVMYSIYYEMVTKPIDYFLRRTGSMYFEIDSVLKYKDEIIKLMSNVLHWSEAEKEKYLMEVEEEIYISKSAI
ncbi:MAG: Aerobic glycerol-3-phosphate dehydrogenase [Bacillales bacterium]|jgi:glycerol-3-phosphate dehydrogenase|nr:Aerobic glycerol-3-phosphate dehydrogenase [Bacillales bacterium]